MQTIIMPNRDTRDTILLHDVPECAAIFAVSKTGELIGLHIKEKQGWILRSGSEAGSHGHHPTLSQCLQRGVELFGYSYFIHYNLNDRQEA